MTYSHPTANCEDAKPLYKKWIDVAERWKKGTKPYEKACLEYKWHVAKCTICQKGLNGGYDE